jgi:MFS family permease
VTGFLPSLRAQLARRRVETGADTEESARAFLSIRKAIGYLAFWLPSVLVVIGLASRDFKPSISEFYYGNGRDVFVGTLVAIGVFLLAYTGHKKEKGERIAPDFLVSKIAGLAILTVAFVPTAGPGSSAKPWLYERFDARLVQGVHLGAATLFFLCLAYFSLRLFRRGKETLPGKKERNRIYRWCGVLILVSVAASAVVLYSAHQRWIPDEVESRWHAIFWLETLGVVSFSVSWLTKGKSILVLPLEKAARLGTTTTRRSRSHAATSRGTSPEKE